MMLRLARHEKEVLNWEPEHQKLEPCRVCEEDAGR